MNESEIEPVRVDFIAAAAAHARAGVALDVLAAAAMTATLQLAAAALGRDGLARYLADLAGRVEAESRGPVQ